MVDPRGVEAVAGPGGTVELYIADCLNHRIRYVAGGIVDTIAGTGTGGFGGDGGPATTALLAAPQDVAVDASGNVYIADTGNNRIRRIDAQTGRISTVAGSGAFGYGGDGAAATAAKLGNPYAVTVGPSAELYIADFVNNRVRKIQNGIISTVAGNGSWGFMGDGGPAIDARLANPSDIAVSRDGTLFIVDRANHRIRRVTPQGTISTIAGGSLSGFAGDGLLAIFSLLNQPLRIALDPAENLIFTDVTNRRVRQIDRQTQLIRTIAGSGTAGQGGDGGPASQAQMESLNGVAVAPNDEIYLSFSTGVSRSPRNRVRRMDVRDVIYASVGGGIGDRADASNALMDPRGTAIVPTVSGPPHLYVADGNLHRVRRIDGETGIIETVAGTGVAGYGGNGGPATNAALNVPQDVTVDGQGNLYIADSLNNVVRRVSPNGAITTYAGTGGFGYGGDGGPAVQAVLAVPLGVAVDSSGNLFIADSVNNRVRKVSPNGTISSVAGNGQWGYAGDNGPATAARLATPADVVVGTDGTLYIAESGGNRIRRVSPAGTITTLAGTGFATFGGDGEVAWAAPLNRPKQIALDAQQNLYVADSDNFRIRRIDARTNVITTIAGSGVNGDDGDGGPPTGASLSHVSGVSIDPAAVHLFVSIAEYGRVRLAVFEQFGPTPSFTPTRTATPVPATATRTWTPVPPPPTRTNTVPRVASPTLSPTRTWTPIPPPPTRTNTVPRVASPTSSPTRTWTPVPPTVATNTPTQPTRTRTPSRTAPPLPTATAPPIIGRTATPIDSPTRTRTPSRTRTPTRTRTSTVRPTATPTARTTAAPSNGTPTITRPPTRTPSPTFTLTRTRTPTKTRTATRRVTATRTRTPTATRTPTRTARATTVPRPQGIRRLLFLDRFSDRIGIRPR